MRLHHGEYLYESVYGEETYAPSKQDGSGAAFRKDRFPNGEQGTDNADSEEILEIV